MIRCYRVPRCQASCSWFILNKNNYCNYRRSIDGLPVSPRNPSQRWTFVAGIQLVLGKPMLMVSRWKKERTLNYPQLFVEVASKERNDGQTCAQSKHVRSCSSSVIPTNNGNHFQHVGDFISEPLSKEHLVRYPVTVVWCLYGPSLVADGARFDTPHFADLPVGREKTT